MVIVKLFMGIYVGHEVKGSMGAPHVRARIDGNAVGLAGAHDSIDFDVGVDQKQVSHLAGLDVVDAKNVWSPNNGLANALDLDLVLIGSAVHEVMQGIPRESPARGGDNGSDDEGSDGVEKGYPIRLATRPKSTTRDEAASERACQALAVMRED